MKRSMFWFANMATAITILILFIGLPQTDKSSEPTKRHILYSIEPGDYPDIAVEARRDMASGEVMRELGIEPDGSVVSEIPPEYGEPKNGDGEYSEPVIVQVINALGNNMTKLMGGLLTLSQILLNFKAYRKRKAVA